MSLGIQDVALSGPEKNTRVLEVADFESDHLAVWCEFSNENRKVPRSLPVVRTFFFRRKPNHDGWYVVLTDELAHARFFSALKEFGLNGRAVQICASNDEQDELLERFGIVIEGSLVEPQYA